MSHSHTESVALGKELAYPCLPPLDPSGTGSAGGYPYPEMGLRKRELFAAMAMQGLVSSISQYSKTKDGSPITESHVAQQAVVFADALIAALTDEEVVK